MVLFVLPSLTSIEMKIFIGIDCIVFIQIGYMITIWISLLLNGKRNGIALPLPVIAFTAYTILLNVFLGDFSAILFLIQKTISVEKTEKLPKNVGVNSP